MGQTLGERESNSHCRLVPNTPRISWHVNCLSDDEGVQLPFVTVTFCYYVAWRVWRCLFRTCPKFVHTYFIRRPVAGYATPNPDGKLTRLSRESLGCETNTVLLHRNAFTDFTTVKYASTKVHGSQQLV